MTEFLIFIVTVALLVLALEPAHRRARRANREPFPRFDPTDRDRQRVEMELRMLGGRGSAADPARAGGVGPRYSPSSIAKRPTVSMPRSGRVQVDPVGGELS